jgi:hypothetical protein
MAGPARGSTAPKRLRLVVRDATAEAANSGNASMMYVFGLLVLVYLFVCLFWGEGRKGHTWIGIKTPIIPIPNGTRPMMGTIQWTL